MTVAVRQGASVSGAAADPSDNVHECGYCLGQFRGRADAKYCCSACKQAAHAALHAEDIDPPSIRRETRSAERAAARLDGIGLMTRREAYDADMRLRRAAGIE